MKMKYITAVLVASTSIACILWYRTRDNRIEDLFGGAKNVAVVANPDRVEAYRVGPLPEGIYWQDAKLGDYPLIAGPVPLADATAYDVSAALLRAETYVWDWAKACIPNYGVQLSFIRGTDRVDVLLCFECDMLLIGRDGKIIGGEDFDNSRATLVRAAKNSFPDDDAIRKL
jgi:hypothetical protein